MFELLSFFYRQSMLVVLSHVKTHPLLRHHIKQK